jgi:hypothetical protein
MEEQVETRNQDIKNIVSDMDAPQFYSPRAIWGFSIFFTVIFGAVLLVSNLADRRARWIVIGFGVLYTALLIAIMNQLPRPNTGLAIALNGGGGYILTRIFWNKYIGSETKFRTKPIWKPLIISILIVTPFILAAIYGDQ